MRSWTNTELERIRKANELKEICRKSMLVKGGPVYILAYYSGGNLVLLRKVLFSYAVIDQTGPWFKTESAFTS